MGKFSNKIIKVCCGIDIDSINSELTNLRLENNRISDLLKSTSKEYNLLNEKYKKTKDSISEHNNSKETYVNELIICKENLETALNDNTSLRKAIADTENKLDNVQNKYDGQSSENSKLNTEIEKLNSEIESLKSINSGLSDTKNSLQSKISILESEKNSAADSYNKLKEELSRLKSEYGSKETENKTIISSLKEEIEKYKENLNNSKKEISSLKENLDKALKEKKEAEEALQEAEDELQSYEDSLDELKSISEGLGAFINQKENELMDEDDEEDDEEEPDSIDDITEQELNAQNGDKEKEKLNNGINALVKKHDYVKITTKTGNQYIYQSKHLQLKSGLFDWGIEGTEIITDENLFLTHDRIAQMEGLDSPFDSEELACDLSNEESAQRLVESLLIAICTYQPIQISYRDKNGRTTTKNLYHISFQPSANKFTLPYKDMFKEMLDESMDTDYISAMCPHNTEPRSFSITQIETIRRYNAYFTTEEGIGIMKEGIALAQKADQQEMVDLLSSKLPNI